jgi:hypothetical protein
LSNVKGVVEAVKEFPSSRGTMYSIKVDGELYGTGSKQPSCNTGDIVAFRFTENGKYKNVDLKSFSVEAQATQQIGKPTSGGFDARQEIISRQSALNSALAFVHVLALADAIPGVGKTTKPEDKYGIIEALVAEKASEYHAASTSGASPGGPVEQTSASVAADKASADKGWK